MISVDIDWMLNAGDDGDVVVVVESFLDQANDDWIRSAVLWCFDDLDRSCSSWSSFRW